MGKSQSAAQDVSLPLSAFYRKPKRDDAPAAIPKTSIRPESGTPRRYLPPHGEALDFAFLPQGAPALLPPPAEPSTPLTAPAMALFLAAD